MKVRIPTIPRPEKKVREWTNAGWSYELYQRSNGSYVIYAASETSDDWRVESAATVKECLEAVNQPSADLLELIEAEA